MVHTQNVFQTKNKIITGYRGGNNSVIEIPDWIEGIGNNAFSNCTNIESVIFAGSVREMGDSIFLNCTNLVNIVFPKGITTITAWMFFGCTKLSSVAIPESVTSIKEYAFQNCSNLCKIVIPTSVSYIGPMAFGGCRNLTIVSVKGSYIEEYAIRNGITFVSLDNTFSCDNVTTIEKQKNTAIQNIIEAGDKCSGEATPSPQYTAKSSEIQSIDLNDKKSLGYAFISYSTKNQTSADAMRDLLRDNGIKTWMAPGDIPAGSKYAQVISRAVKGCSCFILMLSDDAQNSVWVAKEVERAINYRKYIIPIQIEDVVLNDEFELYISTDQVVAISKIDKESEEIKKLLVSVKSLSEDKINS